MLSNNIGAVILAAGRGTRLNCIDKPKVMLEIGGKPIVSYIVETLKKVGFKKEQICLVVGFEKNKVKEYFGDEVIYANQEEQLGTAHAAYTGMKVLSEGIEHVLVLGGDDSAFYRPSTIINFVNQHIEDHYVLSILTIKTQNLSLSGKIIRDEENNLSSVVEKENFDENNKSIDEISTGTYVFDRKWFESIFITMPKILNLDEYGLPTTVEMALLQKKLIQAVQLHKPDEWFGVNTLEELEEANKRMLELVT